MTSEPTIRELTTDRDWDRAVPILGQLWDGKTPAAIRAFRAEPDYRLFGLFEDGTLLAVAGVSVQRVLHHVRHVWIHDLVVDADHRREGHGDELLSWLESWARDRDCQYVALALRGGNDEAAAFYREHGLDTWGSILEAPLG